MSWLSSFLHPGRAYDKAQQQMDQYYGQAQGALSPYMDRGNQVGGGLTDAFGKLMDPAALQAEWMKGYETSPQAQQAQAQAQQHGLDAASSMGLMGSQPALSAIQGGTTQLGFQDRQNYLNDLMNKYTTGIGLGENMYGVGAQTAGQYGQNAMNMGQNSAQMAYGRQAAPGQLFGNLAKTAGNLATSWLTGGMGKGAFGRGALS